MICAIFFFSVVVVVMVFLTGYLVLGGLMFSMSSHPFLVKFSFVS